MLGTSLSDRTNAQRYKLKDSTRAPPTGALGSKTEETRSKGAPAAQDAVLAANFAVHEASTFAIRVPRGTYEIPGPERYIRVRPTMGVQPLV
mgnify:CR=1 FL=1